jgi:tRNA-2-methylthio-N6-dimethylallyladenosine synthase
MGTFHIRTWGCQMNYADTEKIRYVLEKKGLKPVSRMEDADVIILNTCSVRQRAEDKVFGLGRKVAELKRKDPGLIVVLTGCMANRYDRHCRAEKSGTDGSSGKLDPGYLKQLKRKMPWVDHFAEIGDMETLGAIVCGDKGLSYKGYLSASQAYLSDISAYVPISSGCNNFCSYCIVPYTRGGEIHRPFDEIDRQVHELVRNGCRKITLLGQNVNSWQVTWKDTELSFPDLVNAIGEIPGDFWLTYLSSHPKDFSHELADQFRTNPKLCRYLNLAVQSGSDAILKKMNRTYTRDEYLEKTAYLQNAAPDVRISTDIIVGFPGESDKDFQDTMDLLEKVKFGMVYVAEYSPREGAASALMEDTVPPEIKAKRRRIVEDFVRAALKGMNNGRIGETEKVLVLSETKGETVDCQDVLFEEPAERKIGSFANARLTSSSAGGFTGRIVV